MTIPKRFRENTSHTGRCAGTAPLTKEHGVWVFHSGEPLPASATDEILRLMREERDLANLGQGR